ncbi:Hypothetical protein CINCED_3A007563 [Cinara cedri]|nr:Hypothetical protein CINCED_3A007563 [Cinara cedri]
MLSNTTLDDQASGDYIVESNEKCVKTDTDLPTSSYTVLEDQTENHNIPYFLKPKPTSLKYFFNQSVGRKRNEAEYFLRDPVLDYGTFLEMIILLRSKGRDNFVTFHSHYSIDYSTSTISLIIKQIISEKTSTAVEKLNFDEDNENEIKYKLSEEILSFSKS